MATKSQQLKSLKSELSSLQTQLADAKKLAEIDANLSVKVSKNQSHFERVVTTSGKVKSVGRFFLEIEISAKSNTLFIPLSIASGKKPTGFSYHIEGTDEGSIGNANVKFRGEGITEVTVGTLRYVKIPPQKTAECVIQIAIEGKQGNTYSITLTRIHYKLSLSEVRYQQYLKEFKSRNVKLS